MKRWLKKTILAFVITLVLELILWVYNAGGIKCKMDAPCPVFKFAFPLVYQTFIPVFIGVLILIFLISWIISKVRR